MARAGRWRRRALILVVGLVVLYGLALIPERRAEIVTPGGGTSFAWDSDALWHALEQAFIQARQSGCATISSRLDADFASFQDLVERLGREPIATGDPLLDNLESLSFALAARVAACPGRLPEYLSLASAARAAVKLRTQHWDVEDGMVRRRLYRLLYGGRAAAEEALLQQPEGTVPALIPGSEVESATPSATVHGVRIHSGDLLVSRGGAPTSALIARGNDYPGNFSHVALVYIDGESAEVRIIEAHIECGVAISTVEQYLADTKLRIMLLRLRPDLAALVTDPMLPHRAATAAFDRARTEKIPYDFAMDCNDPTRLFCSEVASSAYRQLGIRLWMDMSRISGPGVVSWLSDLGVRHLRTQAPSDLEYDPQLAVVAEWRDPQALWQDHVDNAVIDALLTRAEAEATAGAGSGMPYRRSLLPMARVLKAYSWVRNRCGAVGPIPEGMSATAALKTRWLAAEHQRVRDATLARAERFRMESGYQPPYWQLVRMAREALAAE